MRRLLFLYTFFLLTQTTSATNPFWVSIDKRLIKKIVQLDKNNPESVEQYFKKQKIQKCDTIKENLGFGWKMWTPAIGGGYISISATFYYYEDNIVCYTINPRMPVEKGLIKKYRSWYQNSFGFNEDQIIPFNYNGYKIFQPLKEYHGELSVKLISARLQEYMTPNSGTMYGYSGGYGNNLLKNREAFLEIQDNLTTDQVTILMYSINPASRLTAIEYYLKHRKLFNNQLEIDEWIQKNFTELPKVSTMFGCMEQESDTKSLVYMNSKMIEK